MIIRANNEKIRYTGRWNVKGELATSSAPGNYFEFGFIGTTAQIAFSTAGLAEPFPRIYIIVDGGALVSSVLDCYHRITCENGGEHHVKVLIKSTHETGSDRWTKDLDSRVTLAGVEADGFYKLSPDERPKIEFIGDSITEGIAIDAVDEMYYVEKRLPVHYNDSAADYAYLTAKELNFRPYTMGYGRLGICIEGNGKIPPVINAYGFYSEGEPMESICADYIVINHGTNDLRVEAEVFIPEYEKFLKHVRERNPKSNIIALTPFGGYHREDIKVAVDNYNKENGDEVYYLDSFGWTPVQPLHPFRDGHIEVAKNLSAFIKKTFLE